MKVLHVLYSGLGGHSNVFFSMIDADVQAVFNYEAIFNGVEEIRIDNITQCEGKNIKWQYIKKEPGRHISFIWRLAKAIRKTRADVIFLHGSVNIPAAVIGTLLTFKKQKIIVRETQANHLKSRPEWMALKLALLLANKIVFLSKEYNEEIQKKLSFWYKAKKIKVIPNGLNLDVFKPRVKEPSAYITLGMQSRLVAIKDHATLIHALKLLKQNYTQKKILLKIAGDGSYKNILEQLVVDLSLQEEVEFTGMLKEAELPFFLQSCDIYIHASLGETMSTAIMQAMACRLPVIASDVNGINNMIKHNVTGILVPPTDIGKMTDAILFLLNDDHTRLRLADAAYDFAINNYSNKLMLERYSAIFIDK